MSNQSNLIIPRHVRSRRLSDSGGDMQESGGFITKKALENAAAAFQLEDKSLAQEIDAPIPEGVPQPKQWRVTLMPIRQVTHQGSIMLAPETVDVQDWTHMLWKVAAVGPLVYRGPAWAGFSEEELEAERPKVGELYLADPKQPRRYHYKGVLFIVVNDDQLWSRVEPDNVTGLSFSGLFL
jgi:hypothetical protein